MKKYDNFQYIQAHYKTQTLEEIANHLGITKASLKGQYRKYFFKKNWHTIVKNTTTQCYLVDSRGFNNGKLELIEWGKRPHICKSFVKFQKDNLIRWRAPIINEERTLYKHQIEAYYKELLTPKPEKKWKNSYYVRAKQKLFENITQPELAIHLNVSVNIISQRVRLGLIEKIEGEEALERKKTELLKNEQ
jgi:hypothetical protein